MHGGATITAREHQAIYTGRCQQCIDEDADRVAGSKLFDLDLKGLMDKATKWIFRGKTEKAYNRIAEAYTAQYAQAVQEGVGKLAFEVEWDSPDSKMIKHLQENTYEFSHAKTYHQLQALTDALYDKEGRIIPFSEFSEIASRINNEMAIHHLKTEYTTAVTSASIASRWQEYYADRDLFPNLMYETAGDKLVRPSHERLDGVVRPIEDGFWDRNTPPLSWNCRCTIRQAVGGRKVTPTDKIAEPDDTPALFKTNFARGGMAFPPDHPYNKNLPEELLDVVNMKNPFKYEKTYAGKKGGYIWESVIKDTQGKVDADYLAQSLADRGRKIIRLPEIESDSAIKLELRKMCLPKDLHDKAVNPDSLADGEYLLELKGVDNLTGIGNEISTSNPQAHIYCFRLKTQIPEEDVVRKIKGKLIRDKKEYIKEVWWFTPDGEYHEFSKEKIMNYKFKTKKPKAS